MAARARRLSVHCLTNLRHIVPVSFKGSAGEGSIWILLGLYIAEIVVVMEYRSHKGSGVLLTVHSPKVAVLENIRRRVIRVDCDVVGSGEWTVNSQQASKGIIRK